MLRGLSQRSQVSYIFDRRAKSAAPAIELTSASSSPPIRTRVIATPRRLSIDRNSIRRAVSRLIPSFSSRSRSGIDNSRFSRGIPVRETLQAVYKVHRDKVILEGTLFMLWFTVLVVLTSVLNDVTTAYSAGAAVLNLVRDQEMRDLSFYDKKLEDVRKDYQSAMWV
jgi:hypothetical protein